MEAFIMATVFISESFEQGNKYTGEYKRWERQASFNGTAAEVALLVERTVPKLFSPPGFNSNLLADHDALKYLKK